MLLLFTTVCYSQVSLYFPSNTLHFDKDMLWQYQSNQGGDRGIIASYEIKHVILSAGVIRNSYGEPSKVFTAGLVHDYKYFDVSASLGVADGYNKLYRYNPNAAIGDFFKVNKIVPVGLLVLRVKVCENMGVQVNLSPAYVNYGFYIKI